MQISSLRPERARALFVAGYTTVSEVAAISGVNSLVELFMKSDGFQSHRKSNSEDLRYKYDYLSTLASKVLSEAQQIQLKQKYDPDATVINYLALQLENRFNEGQEYMLLSDSESE